MATDQQTKVECALCGTRVPRDQAVKDPDVGLICDDCDERGDEFREVMIHFHEEGR